MNQEEFNKLENMSTNMNYEFYFIRCCFCYYKNFNDIKFIYSSKKGEIFCNVCAPIKKIAKQTRCHNCKIYKASLFIDTYFEFMVCLDCFLKFHDILYIESKKDREIFYEYCEQQKRLNYK